MKIGMDVGRSGIKASTVRGHLFALPVLAEVSSGEEWCGPNQNHLVGNNGSVYLESWRLGYDGREWLVGERVESLGLPGRYAMRVTKTDPMTRLLVLAGITALGCSGPVELCVGIPLHQVTEEGKAMRELLRGTHVVRVDGSEREITILGMVAPEGLGIWARSVTPDGAAPDPALARRRTVVLDFGHRTIQAAVFAGMNLHPRPYVSAHGSYEVWEGALMTLLESGRGGTVFESPQRAAMMTRLLRDGEIRVRGRRITVAMLQPELRTQAERIWPRVREELHRMLEQVDYERIVAGGGGVHLFGDLLQESFPDGLEILADRFAQADGYRIFMEHLPLFRSL